MYTKFTMIDIKFPFTCGESDLYKNIVKFQNIMTRIVGQTAAIALKLMEPYLEKQLTNNYYNSVSLTEFLSSKGIYITGTLRKDRKRNLKKVISMKLIMGQMV